ncbi:MAG: histidinol-phosphate transaminase [Oscillospiraceae bacterium]
MSYEICEKARDLVPYEPISGFYETRLDANESFINLSENIKEKITKAIFDIDFNRYPDAKFQTLISAFCHRYKLNSENVTAGNGSDELISVIINGLMTRGQKLLTLEPDFSMYRHNGNVCELECLSLQKDENFSIDIKKVCDKINEEKISCLIFSNPCNPTGGIIEKKDIEYLCQNTEALIIADEAYMEFSDEKNSLIGETERFENLIVLKTLSKAIGLAGIRLGFCVSNKKIIKAINALRSPYNINTMTQKVGEIVLGEKEYLDECIKQIKESRDFLVESLKKLDLGFIERVYDTQANFVFIKAKNATKVREFLGEKKIAIRQFGDYLRICAGSMEENNKLFEALKSYKA